MMPTFPGQQATVSSTSTGPNPAIVQSTEVVAAKIIVGDVKPDDQAAQYVESLGGDNEMFTDYKIFSRYENDRHIYMGGVSSPGGFNGNSVAFVQLSNPTLLWIIDWTCCKSGTQPEIPDPFSVDNSWVLMDVHMEPGMITLLADGKTPLWRFSGTYFYGNVGPNSNPFINANFTRRPDIEDVFLRTINLSKLIGELTTIGMTVQLVAPGQISAQLRTVR